MVTPSYVPEPGDIVFLNFNPQSGHEQAGTRSALVLSPKEYNVKTGLMIACPITQQKKEYPFEVDLGDAGKVKGVVLSDHVKNLDWRARKARFVERTDMRIYRETVDKLQTLLSQYTVSR